MVSEGSEQPLSTPASLSRHATRHAPARTIRTMARRGISEAQKRLAAIQGGRRIVSGGGQPLYRIRAAEDGSWESEFPGLTLRATTRAEALSEAQAAIAAILEVDSAAVKILAD